MNTRTQRLLPAGVPRYVRCYDNGGESIDRYTAVFTGRFPKDSDHRGKAWPYLAMNAAPFHPQGFGQHGESNGQPCDVNGSGFAPSIGRKCHLGRRIPFTELPDDCRKLTLRDYRELWGIE